MTDKLNLNELGEKPALPEDFEYMGGRFQPTKEQLLEIAADQAGRSWGDVLEEEAKGPDYKYLGR